MRISISPEQLASGGVARKSNAQKSKDMAALRLSNEGFPSVRGRRTPGIHLMLIITLFTEGLLSGAKVHRNKA